MSEPTADDLLIAMRKSNGGGRSPKWVGQCKWGIEYARLPDGPVKHALGLAEHDPQVSAEQMRNLLLAALPDAVVSMTTLRNHRAGRCVCVGVTR